MRKQLLSVFLPMLILGLVASAAEMPASQPASQPNELQRVNVVRGADEIRVEISARGVVAPKVSTESSPARLVLDLPGTVMATGQTHIAVGSAGVKGVRIGTDGQTPPTTRVVVDLEHACRYELTPSADGKLVLTLHTQPAAAATKASAPKTVADATPAPASKNMSPFAPRVMEVEAPKAQPAVAGAPVVPNVTAKDAIPSATVPATTQKSGAAAASTSDFVFVEPSYEAKKTTTAEATEEPSVRAGDAAAKFADKTAAELLPVSANAAQASQSTSSNTGVQPAVNLAAEQRAQAGQAPAAVGPKYTGEPISVNLKDVDLKDFFRLIHEISGLNVVLDPNVHGTLTVVLDDVPWDQALDIVLKNNDLARELEGNVLRIATVDTLKKEADGRRAQVEAEALAVEKVSVTRFLSYAHAKDVIITVKKFLSVRGDVVADERTNAVIVNDIPKVLPVIDRLLTQLDRKTQEVEIEARVVAATRQFARDIGTQLGFGWGNGHSAIGGAQGVGASPTTVSGLAPGYITVPPPAGGSTSGSSIPLFSNLGSTSPTSGFTFLNASNTVRIDAVLSMAESRGLLKVLSRPRVVTQNNIQALVKQGVRVPIVTQAQLGGPPTVTYVDAFLRLTVTPQITSENTIFLNVDVENTTPNFGQEVQGNPELITQQATTQVLVTDGGTVVIGGVIQTQNSINIDQVPVLGNIPILGNLFKHTVVNTSNQELIFFITPRIIQT
ncbi:MAG TPA: type IV pilus secretin PilQ [Candidatus Sulfotelmatobacter sp.]|jgi:type IV pilus assembly protein PilQ|nr:type IV pilus secretin PilQ [Candidatus Sulfotelmatobacter sp.]